MVKYYCVNCKREEGNDIELTKLNETEYICEDCYMDGAMATEEFE